MKKLNVLCDLDGIAAKLLEAWLKAYNDEYGLGVKVEDIIHWKMHKCPKIVHGSEIFKYLDIPDLYKNLEPVPGACEGLKKISDAGHNVFIATATPINVQAASDKMFWVKKHLPWLHHNNVFIGHFKHMIKGDVLIDDGPHNLVDYRNHWGSDPRLCTIAYPYNESVKDYCNCYAESWAEPEKAWAQMTDFILDAGSRA